MKIKYFENFSYIYVENNKNKKKSSDFTFFPKSESSRTFLTRAWVCVFHFMDSFLFDFDLLVRVLGLTCWCIWDVLSCSVQRTLYVNQPPCWMNIYKECFCFEHNNQCLLFSVFLFCIFLI